MKATDLSPLPDSDAALLREALADAWPDAGAATPPGAGAAALAVAIARDVRVPCVLAVAGDPAGLEAFAADAAAMLGEGDCLRSFPMAADEAPASPAVTSRASAISALGAAGPGRTGAAKPGRRPPNLVLCTCSAALAQPAPDPDLAQSLGLAFEVGRPPRAPEGEAQPTNGPEGSGEWLQAHGYRRAPEVFEPGVWAARGGVLDVWPVAALVPSRIEFFGDEVESVRTFDHTTQRSDRQIGNLLVPPAVLPEDRRRLLADFLPKGTVALWLGAGAAADRRCASARAAAARNLFLGLPVPEGVTEATLPFAPPDAGAAPLARGMDDWGDPDVAAARRRATIERAAEAARLGARVRACVDTAGALSSVRPAFAAVPGALLRALPISGGFAITGANGAPRSLWLSQSDIFGRAKRMFRDAPLEADGPADAIAALASAIDAEPPAPRAALDRAPRQGQDPAAALAARILENISPGDLVVHDEHGIGRYVGMERLEIAGRTQDTLVIEYAGGTLLHVPLSKAHLVSRYSGTEDESAVRLHAIGSKRWAAERRAAEDSVRRLAAGMLRRQAMRRELSGRPFDADTPYLEQFEASFPYVETPGQAECISRVYEDMQSPRPMDRLVCGDAGYGKTEIALRAAFVCAMQGRQVAVLAPTTVLAQQHYELFRDRFAPYPVRIALHSAFVSGARRAEAERGAADGTVDILVGTHGILGKNVRFKDLGLVIVDEEQRFGVGQKEKLKESTVMVDVLTLSATPIPRSLYLGLVGARDLSLLSSPPPGRMAIRTKVAVRSEKVIREAVGREIARGGQVFYLHNRVATLPIVAGNLRRMFPELRIGVGHGQMAASETAAVMRDFVAGRFDMLLSTTIIENGVDVPRANTIIVDGADRFGIADLYQLRGRVGRSHEQAWAYFLVKSPDTLSSDARQRLEALQNASDLGCGVSLAMRDLAIRGAGNLLGAEQSGHIAAVGFRLYCQLLRRAVARLRGETPPLLVNTELELPFLSPSPDATGAAPARMPREYAGDDSARILFHRRLSECSGEAELDALRAETTDRFGAPPPELSRLYEATRLRILAAERGISRVRVERESGRLFMYRDGAPIRFRGALPVPAGNTPDELLASTTRLVRAQERRAQNPTEEPIPRSPESQGRG